MSLYNPPLPQPPPPPKKKEVIEILGVGERELSKVKIFKEMYEAEFTEGGGLGGNSLPEGCRNIFWDHTIKQMTITYISNLDN